MSINGVFRTSVSGMNAQANRLSAVSDNIANTSTNGYKRGSVEFSSLVLPNNGGDYNPGTVKTQVRYSISQQGNIASTSSGSDLAITGNGFFVVQDGSGRDYFTRAGSFVQKTDPDTGVTSLVNAAGYQLVGRKIPDGGTEPIELPVGALIAPKASARADIAAQLPSGDEVGSEKMTSLTVYDRLGAEHTIDIKSTKIAGATAGPPATSGTWTIEMGDRAGGSTVTPNPATIEFGLDGQPIGGPPSFSVTLTDGTTIAANFASLSQYDSDYDANVSSDGNPAGAISEFTFDENGRLSGILSTGNVIPLYDIALASFTSPDQLTPKAGNVYVASNSSGDAKFGTAGANGFGGIISGALEQSNVDLASELTTMIESQRSYSANSKVFQTGSEILDVLVNLKR